MKRNYYQQEIDGTNQGSTEKSENYSRGKNSGSGSTAGGVLD
jgi:hypothetical protein